MTADEIKAWNLRMMREQTETLLFHVEQYEAQGAMPETVARYRARIERNRREIERLTES